jgi:hypothetical protein
MISDLQHSASSNSSEWFSLATAAAAHARHHRRNNHRNRRRRRHWRRSPFKKRPCMLSHLITYPPLRITTSNTISIIITIITAIIIIITMVIITTIIMLPIIYLKWNARINGQARPSLLDCYALEVATKAFEATQIFVAAGQWSQRVPKIVHVVSVSWLLWGQCNWRHSLKTDHIK